MLETRFLPSIPASECIAPAKENSHEVVSLLANELGTALLGMETAKSWQKLLSCVEAINECFARELNVRSAVTLETSPEALVNTRVVSYYDYRLRLQQELLTCRNKLSGYGRMAISLPDLRILLLPQLNQINKTWNQLMAQTNRPAPNDGPFIPPPVVTARGVVATQFGKY